MTTPTDGLGTVLVTGGSSGLGAAVAAAVEAEGGTPVVLDRRAPANGFAWQEVDLADSREAEAVAVSYTHLTLPTKRIV